MKKRLKIIYAVFCIVFVSAAFAPRAEAHLTSSFDVLNFKPAISNNTDYFGIYSSRTVGRNGWNAGFYADFAHHPLEIGQPLGSRVLGVVDDTITGDFYATYGILDWFSVGLNIPIVFYNNFVDNVPQLPFGTGSGIRDKQTNLGDIRLEFKFRILNNEDKLIGLALLPFVTMPSGDSNVFMGNGNAQGGLKIVLDFNIHKRVNIALNVGALARDGVQVLNAKIDDQLLLGLGLSIKIIERLMFIAEIENSTNLNDLFGNEVSTPLEARGGFRVKLNDHFNINVGGGAGLTVGVGSPDFRAFLGLNYNWVPAPCAACERPPQIEAKEIMIDQVIHFEFDKANIRPQSYPILKDVASIIKSNQNGISKVMVEGNTDSIGSDAYNQKLSERRAMSVKNFLVKEGVPATMLDAVGYGESRPVATNDTAEGRALNRRTQFKVVPK
jgi:outer membrane protein OmpA-like peptidoglycan-associated protein